MEKEDILPPPFFIGEDDLAYAMCVHTRVCVYTYTHRSFFTVELHLVFMLIGT